MRRTVCIQDEHTRRARYGRIQPMRQRLPQGVWELFVPGVGAGARYKFELVAAAGGLPA